MHSPLASGVLQRHGVAGHRAPARAAGPIEQSVNVPDRFTGSKIRDAQGALLKVYHGTPNSFDVFDPKRARENGFYFTADPEHAEMYAGPRGVLMPVHLALCNPMQVDGWQLPPRASQKLMKSMIADAKATGHDGVVISRFRDHIWGTSDTYIAFEPEQIRSVFDLRPVVAEEPEEPAQTTRDAAFLDWHAGSKAVDENGVPLMLFHGTASAFSTFDVPHRGAYFSSDETVAQAYASYAVTKRRGTAPQVKAAYLAVKNPLVLNMRGRTYTYRTFERAIVEAKCNGHDGLHFRNVDDMPWGTSTTRSDVWVVFAADQIMSVDYIARHDLPAAPAAKRDEHDSYTP